ncbi:MAG: hypothetical protein ACTSW4_06595 [Candidatus Ranarchaeia archaeon]
MGGDTVAKRKIFITESNNFFADLDSPQLVGVSTTSPKKRKQEMN